MDWLSKAGMNTKILFTFLLNLKVKKTNFFILIFVWLSFINCGDHNNFSSKASAKQNVNLALKKAPVSLEVDSSYKDIAANIDQFFTNRFKKGLFNGNILFAKNGKIVIKKSYGYADVNKKTPLELTTRFQLASASKPFTAFAVLLLQDRGKLHVEDPIQNYIPGFPYKNINLRLLLSHRSGLGKYNFFCENLWKNKSVYMSNKDLVDIMMKNPHLTMCAPDKAFIYCNTNFCLLASVIEKVSGTNYKKFMEDEIFHKLGMNNTFILNIKDTNDLKRRINSFDARNRMIYDNYMDGLVGDKGIFSTVEDMFIFDQSLYHGDLIAPGKMKEAFTAKSSAWKSGVKNYGYGWRIVKLPDGREIPYHCGWWHGFRSYFIRVPENKGTIIILNNSMRGSFIPVAELLKMIGEYQETKNSKIQDADTSNQNTEE